MNPLGKNIKNIININFGTKIAAITIVIIIATVLILSVFTYTAQEQAINNQMKMEVHSNVNKLVSDVNSYNQTVKILKESLQNNNLKLAKSVREILKGRNSYTTAELSALANKIGVSEVNVMNDKGIMQFSSNPALINYKYDSYQQSKPFMEAITNKNFELAQEPAIRGADKKMFMYIGVARQDKAGMFQLGMEPVEYQKVVDSINLQDAIKKYSFAKTGFTFIANPQGVLIAHPQKDYIGKNLNTLPFGKLITTDNEGDFQYKEGGKIKYLAFKRTFDGTLIMATVETDDYFHSLYTLMFKFILCGFIIVLISIGFVLFYSRRNIAKPIIEIQGTMKEIALGNLKHVFTSTRKDEIGQMFNHLNQMSSSLRELIGKISANSEQVAASAEELLASAEQTGKATEQIASTIQEVAVGTDKQTKSVEKSSQTIGELAVSVQKIADNAQHVSASASDTLERAEEGAKNIQLAIKQMNAINHTVTGLSEVVQTLGERSNEISQIVQVITDISSQTNLLALNAAIEAARAGEHGKGFAVVADEVRKLAEQSSNSAQQIAHLIKAIQEETNKTVRSMDHATKEVVEGIGVVNLAGESFEQIQNSVNDVATQIEQVSSAVQQISAATEGVVHSIALISEVAEVTSSETHNVSAATEEQLASMEEISSSASSLAKMAEELQEAIGKFKV
ncbi:methyl-accepting chemotaxis protein [Aneurinibacillus terranovensis]|uniref:methyl-accepting chemotaxis protein n=1 Tax=Aneurinibacillus terranovensis TaxID=278991 RepID=UPI00041A9226|nr:methyl-accepting chemotaxis protein [Aneurinibacillus terranovensis]